MGKKIIAGLVGVLVVAVVVSLGLALVQPETYRVERSIEIIGTPEVVYTKIADLKMWPEWSPWAKLDPQMEVNYSEGTSGVGAFSTWKSETQGHGKQTIVFEEANRSVKTELEFFKPMEGKAQADFTITPIDEQRFSLTWGMDGYNTNVVEKFFYAVMDFDSIIGEMYEDGLTSLKTIAEANTNEEEVMTSEEISNIEEATDVSEETEASDTTETVE